MIIFINIIIPSNKQYATNIFDSFAVIYFSSIHSIYIIIMNIIFLLKHALFLYQKQMYDKIGELSPAQRVTLQSIVEKLSLTT